MTSNQSSDDEFSSGSSVDPSQLVIDWNPPTQHSHSASAQNEEEKTSEIRHENTIDTGRSDANKEHPKTNEKNFESGESGNNARDAAKLPTLAEKEEVRIVLGSNILDWQKELKGVGLKEKTTEWITVRTETSETPPKGSKLLVKSSNATLVIDTEHGLQAQTGQRTSSAGAWVDCIAVYDETQQAYVLSKVDWSANVKHDTTESTDATQRKRLPAAIPASPRGSPKRYCR